MSEDLYKRFKDAVIKKERNGIKKVAVATDVIPLLEGLKIARKTYYTFIDKQDKTENENLIKRYLDEEKTFDLDEGLLRNLIKLEKDHITGKQIEIDRLDPRIVALYFQLAGAKVALQEDGNINFLTPDEYNPEVIKLVGDRWREEKEAEAQQEAEAQREAEALREAEAEAQREARSKETAKGAEGKKFGIEVNDKAAFINPLIYGEAPKPEAQQSSGFFGWVAKGLKSLRGPTTSSSEEPPPPVPAPSDSGNVGNTHQKLLADGFTHGTSKVLENRREGPPRSRQKKGGGKTRSRCKKTKRNKCKSKTRSKKHTR
jgi:hypothetical protein